MFDRIQDTAPGATQTYSAKSALFTAGVGDRGTYFDSTGSFTITLDTTGMSAGWSAWFRTVSGTQTFDPSGGTLINGASTYAVSNAGDVVLVEYTGSAFVVSHAQRPSTVAITGGTINATTIGATTPASGAFTTITASSTLVVTGNTTIGATTGTATALANIAAGTAGTGTATLRMGTLTRDWEWKALASTGSTYPMTLSYIGTDAAVANIISILKTGPITFGTASPLTISSTTASTSNTSGAIVVSGGAGVAGALNVGGGATVTGGDFLLTGANKMALSSAVSASVKLYITNAGSLTGTTQVAVQANFAGSSGGTSNLTGFRCDMDTAAAAYTVANVFGFYAATQTLGAGSTVTRFTGVHITRSAVATNNCAFGYKNSGLPSFTGNWFLYNDSADGSYLGTGDVQVASTTASTSTTTGALVVSGGIGIAGRASIGGDAVLSANLLMNASTAQSVAVSGTTIIPVIQGHGTGGNASSATIARYSGAATGGFFVLAKSRGTSVGSLTIVQDGDQLGSIEWNGSDGSAFREAAMIRAEVDGTPGASDMPGRLLFMTSADGGVTPTEAMRIDAAQRVIIASGKALRLGNAAVAATPTATHTITVQDSTGTTYRLLCVV